MNKVTIETSSFEARCRKIVDDTALIGWGFHDALSDSYHEHFKP